MNYLKNDHDHIIMVVDLFLFFLLRRELFYPPHTQFKLGLLILDNKIEWKKVSKRIELNEFEL